MATASNSPCGACKFLRRKCAPECTFAPYFPPDQPLKFSNAHKIFGASNISKILSELPVHQRAAAVNSLAYEAQARMKDPVYGCVGAISYLKRHIEGLESELRAAKAELARYVQQENTGSAALLQQHDQRRLAISLQTSPLNDTVATHNMIATAAVDHHHQALLAAHHHNSSGNVNDSATGGSEQLWMVQQQHGLPIYHEAEFVGNSLEMPAAGAIRVGAGGRFLHPTAASISTIHDGIRSPGGSTGGGGGDQGGATSNQLSCTSLSSP